MEGLAIILTACIVIFLYLHISFHLKTSSETEVLEVAVESKRDLEEACGLRQPLLFKYAVLDNLQFSQNASVQDASGALFEDWRNALNEGKQTRFAPFVSIDTQFLCPPMTAYTSPQIVAGNSAQTPFWQSDFFRTFIVVCEGEVEVAFSSPRAPLQYKKDYANMCGESAAVPLNATKITAAEGQTVFVPAYWGYGLKFEKPAVVYVCRYKTWMNALATLPDVIASLVQRQKTLIVEV
jgi:hypothetical protein